MPDRHKWSVSVWWREGLKTTGQLDSTHQRRSAAAGAMTFDAAVCERAIALAAGHHADAEIFEIPFVD